MSNTFSRRYVWVNNLLIVLLMTVTGTSWTYAMFFRGQAGFFRGQTGPVKREEFAKEIENRLGENASAIEAEAQALAAEVLPPLAEAVYRETRQAYPKYLRKLEAESEVLAEHVQQIFMEAVKDQYRDYLQRHRQVLAEEFPEHADQESVDQIMSEFEQLADRIVERYYLDEFRIESKRTTEVWGRFRPLEPPSPDQPSLEEQLTKYLADWSVLAFTEEASEQLGEN